MNKLTVVAAVATIVGAIAGVAMLFIALLPQPDQQAQRVPSESARKRTDVNFDDFRNPLDGTGCDAQCLPILTPNGGTIELYNRAFGITNVKGTLQTRNGELTRFSADYLPGRHGWFNPKLKIPGSEYQVCMSGVIEGRNIPITWLASYRGVQRISPVDMKIGKEATACP